MQLAMMKHSKGLKWGGIDPRYMFKNVWHYNQYSSATIIDLF